MSKYDKAKHSKKKVKSLQFLAILFLIIIIVVLFYYLYQWHLSKKNKDIYEQINVSSQKDMEEKKSENMKKLEIVSKENKDIIGWIQIDNTTINYPLLQTTNNDYYLTHNYKKEKSKYGSIFLNKESNLLDENSNLIIYGHNMDDKQMFYPLLHYIDKKYYDAHKNIQITTTEKENNYEIVAIFRTKVFYENEENIFKYYDYINFKSEKEYNEFINNCKKMQLYDTEVSAKYGEQLITLVTCEYSQTNGRLVVVAKRV